MKQFNDENFLLETKTAQDLYHNHAAKMPIIDYHCHLLPQWVAENKKFTSITQLWLGDKNFAKDSMNKGDHYKFRAMRTNGVPERYCTGNDTTEWEKFEKWAETVPYTFRNPLYHWTHLELKTAFGIEKTLNPETAREIYDQCNEMIANDPKFCPRGLMEHYNVELVCTTDDPVDSLEYHDIVAADPTCKTRMVPAWRPDAAMNIEAPGWAAYILKLSKVADVDIKDFKSLLEALQKRHDFFTSKGCKLSDHGIEEFYDEAYTTEEIDTIIQKALKGEAICEGCQRKFKHAFLYEMAVMDCKAGWTQQFHYGALRNNNSLMNEKIGADTGFDSIGEFTTAKAMSHFLDELNREGNLTKTILYNLNPCANEVIATMLGNFQDGSCAGKIQMGSGWWFLDQKDGMEKMMNSLSVLGLLSRFVGMLTDSRSCLSYPRHEYFRRTLCNLIGKDIENGLIPFTGYEEKRVRQMIEDICYNNAKNYFNF